MKKEDFFDHRGQWHGPGPGGGPPPHAEAPPPLSEEERAKRRRKKRRTTLLFVALLVVMLLPQLYVGRYIGQLLPHWPVLARFLLTVGVWMVVLYLLMWAVFAMLRHHVKKRAKEFEHVPNMFDDVIDGIDRIAQGDYNVVIKTDERFRYSELGDKVNLLANRLCSAEQMRQDFVSNVSHEIQSPLTSITGFAELLKNPDLSEKDRLHYIEVIESEARRMSKMSDNLMRLSLLENDGTEVEFSPFRLDKQIEDTLLALEPQWAGKDIEPDVALLPCDYMGDEELLAQVWQNLLQNAVKFTPNGGCIGVRMTEADNTLTCEMRDNGVGMPEEDLVHIFERFYKVDKARDRSLGGNGLGLALVKKIVELHGGRVSARSAPGEGSVFTVVLPLGADGEDAKSGP